MKETIYLTVSRFRVERMGKRLPTLSRGEIPVKLIVQIDDAAFREPVLEHHVHIADWRQGFEIADVEFREGIITEEEAAIIRARRLQQMRSILEGAGYEVREREPEPEAGPDA